MTDDQLRDALRKVGGCLVEDGVGCHYKSIAGYCAPCKERVRLQKLHVETPNCKSCGKRKAQFCLAAGLSMPQFWCAPCVKALGPKPKAMTLGLGGGELIDTNIIEIE